jgi:hypothetical protein
MINEIQLPEDYQPVDTLILCSNILVNVRIPFEVEGGVPILVGKNGRPQVWLYARPPSPEMPWLPVVRQNHSLHKKVCVHEMGKSAITVVIQGVTVLAVEKREVNRVEVVELDLRPFGLTIYGDNTKLMIGSHTFAKNTFTNLEVMLRIGGSPKSKKS